MSEVETRYLVVSGSKFAPPAPAIIIGGEMTPANIASALWGMKSAYINCRTDYNYSRISHTVGIQGSRPKILACGRRGQKRALLCVASAEMVCWAGYISKNVHAI